MSFTAVIPEVIAAQIVAGDNGATLALASTALTALAAQLGDTAAIWTSTFAGLTGDDGVAGRGAAAALAAADQYINWLTTTQAEVEAAQTAVAASLAAYEAARTGVVDVATVAANRTATTAALAAMPFSAAAVAALETAYAAFEATDLTVMNAYQAADTAALPALTAPPQDVTGAILPITAAAAPAAAAADPAATLSAGSLITSLDGLIGTPAVSNPSTAPSTPRLGSSVTPSRPRYRWGTRLGPPRCQRSRSATWCRRCCSRRDGRDRGRLGVADGRRGQLGRHGSVGRRWRGNHGRQAFGAGHLGGSHSAEATLASSTAPLGGSGWTVAAEEAGTGGMGAPGMPGMVGGAGAKGAGAFAGPRYGTKPIVMPKSVVV